MPSKERQRQLAREKVQRQMARRAAIVARRRRRQAILGSAAAVVAVIALAGFAFSQLGGSKPAAKKKPLVKPPNTALCSYTRPKAGQGAQVPRKVGLPPINGIRRSGLVKVQLVTSQGPLTLTLDAAKAPCTVNSFVSLVQQKYFDKTPCHRLTTRGIFVLQCGDPSGSGSGGPGYVFADENLPAQSNAPIVYRTGTVAMANSGPNTNGSQFFIVYKDTQFNPSYIIFGSVSAGLPVVTKVAAAGSKPAGDGKPIKPVLIQTAKILP